MRLGFGMDAAKIWMLVGVVGIILSGCSDGSRPSSATSPQSTFPVIDHFLADNYEIVSGTNTKLTAQFRNGTASIDQGIGVVTSGIPVIINPTETTTYTLTVSGKGKTDTFSLVVNVTKPVIEQRDLGTLDNPCEFHQPQSVTGISPKRATSEAATCVSFGAITPMLGALSISSNGHVAAHIGVNDDIVIWNIDDIKPLEKIPSNGNKPSAIAVSPDGNLIAIGYLDSRVIIISRLENKLLREFKGHISGITALAFSLDGQMLASGGDDATTQIWEISTGRRLRIFDSQLEGSEHGGIVVSLGFSGNGRVIAVNEWYNRLNEVGRGITLWDIEKGIEISTRNVAPPKADNTLRAGQAMGGKGWLLAYTGDKGVMFERLDRCGPVSQMLSGHHAETVAADPQGRWLASAELEQLTFFGVNGDTTKYSIALPTKVIALEPHPDGRTIFALMAKQDRIYDDENLNYGLEAETGMGITLYRIQVPKSLWSLPPLVVKENATHCPPTKEAQLKQDFQFPDMPSKLQIVTRLVMPYTTHATQGLRFTQDGNLIVGSSYETVWNLRTKQLLPKTDETPSWCGLMNQEGGPGARDKDNGNCFRILNGRTKHFLSDGQSQPDIDTNGNKPTMLSARNGRLAVLYEDNRVQIWHAKTGQMSKLFGPLQIMENCFIANLTLSADGLYLQTELDCGDRGQTFWMFDFESGRWAPKETYVAPFQSHASRKVIQDARPHHLAVLDIAKAEIIARLPRHESRDWNGIYKPLLATISDDGRLVASASYDGLVRIWDINSHKMVGEANLGGEVMAMAFDLHGTQLAAEMVGGQISILQMTDLQAIAPK